MKDIKGAWRTYSLFCEYSQDYPCYWTIQDTSRVVDDVTYPSLKQIYLSYEHTPFNEYDFAITVIGSWEHWCRLCKSPKLKEHISMWRDELEVKIRSNAIKSIIRTSLEETSAGATSAKWLAEKGYAPKRGRPSKEEKEGFLKQEKKIIDEVEDDLIRVGLKAVK
mgnify:FL=1